MMEKPAMDTMESGLISFETTLGTCAVRWTSAGIAGVRLPGDRTATLPRLDNRIAATVPIGVRAAIEQIAAVLAGSPRDLGPIQLDFGEIEPLRRQVYAATRRIPFGSTATYGEVARAIGRTGPEAAREVGAALARNPFPIIVPCHRVLGANGKLTGFSAPGGLATKRRMLQLEGAPGFDQQVLFG
jgi:methylated-DNA-[protein]-cysteine S-methyltransferase